MRIEPQAYNAIKIILEDGTEFELHDVDGALQVRGTCFADSITDKTNLKRSKPQRHFHLKISPDHKAKKGEEDES